MYFLLKEYDKKLLYHHHTFIHLTHENLGAIFKRKIY